jgi:hypothetical protein
MFVKRRKSEYMCNGNIADAWPVYLEAYDMTIRDRVSSISIVFEYGLDYRAIEVRSPAEAKNFFL